MATIMSVNVCDSKYNADPTGVRDSTSAIQKAIDDVAAQGGGSVEIPGGMYRVSYPFIEMKHRVEIFGHGQATRIVAFTDKSIPSSKNGSYECTGVFHTGSYTTPMSGGTNQNKPMRMACVTCSSAPTSTTCRWILRATRFSWRSTPSPLTTLQASSSTLALRC